MVNDYKEIKIETNYTPSEFFIMYKYRKHGVRTNVTKEIFRRFKRKWQLMYHPKNIISKHFWNKVVKEYTKEKYEIIKDNGKQSMKMEQWRKN